MDDARGISFRSLYLPQPLFSKVAHQVTGRAAANPQFPEMLVADAAIKESFLRLHCSLEETQSDGGSRLQQEDLLLQFLHLLITRGSDAHATSQALKRERHAVRRVREYIQEHFSGSIALTDLAGLANLSPFHLHRVFALETGMPPHAYQTLLRVNRAKDLLRAGWRLSEVALATGFADQSHLTRHFRRLVGTTPGRFTADRKNVQDTPAHA